MMGTHAGSRSPESGCNPLRNRCRNGQFCPLRRSSWSAGRSAGEERPAAVVRSEEEAGIGQRPRHEAGGARDGRADGGPGSADGHRGHGIGGAAPQPRDRCDHLHPRRRPSLFLGGRHTRAPQGQGHLLWRSGGILLRSLAGVLRASCSRRCI